MCRKRKNQIYICRNWLLQWAPVGAGLKHAPNDLQPPDSNHGGSANSQNSSGEDPVEDEVRRRRWAPWFSHFKASSEGPWTSKLLTYHRSWRSSSPQQLPKPGYSATTPRNGWCKFQNIPLTTDARNFCVSCQLNEVQLLAGNSGKYNILCVQKIFCVQKIVGYHTQSRR